MSVRLVSRVVNDAATDALDRHAKVYFDSDLQEYRVKMYHGTVHLHAADYFTDDKQDALAVAWLFVA